MLLLTFIVQSHEIWPYRLMVRTSPSHGGNPGSNPGRVTVDKTEKHCLIRQCFSVLAHKLLCVRVNCEGGDIISSRFLAKKLVEPRSHYKGISIFLTPCSRKKNWSRALSILSTECEQILSDS